MPEGFGLVSVPLCGFWAIVMALIVETMTDVTVKEYKMYYITLSSLQVVWDGFVAHMQLFYIFYMKVIDMWWSATAVFKTVEQKSV